MNYLIIMFTAFLCLEPSSQSEAPFNNPLNHIVSYESYFMTKESADVETDACNKSLYFFSNHTEKAIQVKYMQTEGEKTEMQTITLGPLVSEETSGPQRTITRPKKIGESCAIQYEIIEAWFVE